MKILRRNDEFKKAPDKSVQDILTINAFIRNGWKHCSKKEYKDYYKVEETPITEKPEKLTKENKNKNKHV